MSDTAPAIPLFGDAYLADTRHLSLEEHGAYLQLLMIAWRSPNCALPDDDARIARMLGITAGRWAKLKGTVMAFWSLGTSGWTQKRLSKERAFVEKKRKTNSDAANARWKKQPIEKVGGDECERISERNAPPPPPNIAAKAASARASEIDAAGLMVELCQAIGADIPDPGKNFDQHSRRVAFVQTWIDAGADTDTIRNIVRGKLAATSSNPRTLQWFDGAVRDAIAARKSTTRSPELAAALKMAEGIHAEKLRAQR